MMFVVPPDCTSLQSLVSQERMGALPRKGSGSPYRVILVIGAVFNVKVPNLSVGYYTSL